MLDQTIAENLNVLKTGLSITLTQEQYTELADFLKNYGFNPNLYLVYQQDNLYYLDYRIYGLLYENLHESIFHEHNQPCNPHETIHAQWLQREGQETYIYYSPDELITKVADICLLNNKEYILCPISKDHNISIPRLCYQELLKESLEITSTDGSYIDMKEGKRIIHFMKMDIKQAYCILQDIVNQNPQAYYHLAQFIDEKLKPLLETESYEANYTTRRIT